MALNSAIQCGGETIAGQGSTLQRIAQTVWDSGFNTSADASACSGSQDTKGIPHVAYSATGSGAGLSSWGVQAGNASYGRNDAFVGTDEPPSASQIQEIEAHEPTLMAPEIETVPVLQAAIAIIVHLPQGCTATSSAAAGRLALNYATLEQIFRGSVTKWSQITEGGDKLSGASCNAATTITPVVRRDQSGTSHILKKYLGLVYSGSFEGESGESTSWNAVAEGPANTQWPKAAKVVRPAGNGAEALVSTVATTTGSIGYVNLGDARNSAMFVPPTGGSGTATFWAVLQNGAETYADPSSNKDVAAAAEANCSKEVYTNGTENPFPPGSVNGSWAGVTTKLSEPKYSLCGLTYDLVIRRYATFGGTEAREATTARDFLAFVLDTSKESEGNGANGGQALIKKHDYLELSGTVLKEAQHDAAAVGF